MNALLVITSIILFLAIINLHLWHRRKAKNFPVQHIQAESTCFTSDLAALNAGSIGLGERLLKIERNQKLLMQRLEQLELHANGNASYSQAINLVKQGINKQDLMATCELSEGEAGLLLMMHKKKKQRKSQFSH
jgi:sulfate adenylyltransferase subunit 1 (EFTu-like GTPase family)